MTGSTVVLRRRPTGPAPVRARRVMPRVAAAVLAGHGALHLMGVALLWRLAQPGTLRYADVLPAAGPGVRTVVGAAWLAASVVLVVAAALVLAGRSAWRLAAAAGAALSAAVLVPAAAVAPVGLVVDSAIVVALAGSALARRRQ